MSKPALLCPHCGAAISPAVDTCPACWKHVNYRWVGRSLRRGLVWSLVALGAIVGGLSLWKYLMMAQDSYRELDAVQGVLDAAESVCRSRGCPPEIRQARELYEAGRHKISAGNS